MASKYHRARQPLVLTQCTTLLDLLTEHLVEMFAPSPTYSVLLFFARDYSAQKNIIETNLLNAIVKHFVLKM